MEVKTAIQSDTIRFDEYLGLREMSEEEIEEIDWIENVEHEKNMRTEDKFATSASIQGVDDTVILAEKDAEDGEPVTGMDFQCSRDVEELIENILDMDGDKVDWKYTDREDTKRLIVEFEVDDSVENLVEHLSNPGNFIEITYGDYTYVVHLRSSEVLEVRGTTKSDEEYKYLVGAEKLTDEVNRMEKALGYVEDEIESLDYSVYRYKVPTRKLPSQDELDSVQVSDNIYLVEGEDVEIYIEYADRAYRSNMVAYYTSGCAPSTETVASLIGIDETDSISNSVTKEEFVIGEGESTGTRLTPPTAIEKAVCKYRNS